MFLLILSLAFAIETPHRIQAMISDSQAKTSGGAYIVRSFYVDQKEFSLQSSTANQVDALLWYPSGKVYARYKQGKTKFLGQGNPVNGSQTVNFYFPEDLQLRLRQQINYEESKELRTLTHKAILTDPEGEDVFLESSQTQILQESQWVTP
jgi:hypothetical protein